MPVYDIRQLKEEFVTPQHSSAFGSLITGERIELGLLLYKVGKGAKEHAHPQEQILLLLKGRARLTLGAEVFDLGPGLAAPIPTHVPHSLSVREFAEVFIAKSIVGGAGHRICGGGH